MTRTIVFVGTLPPLAGGAGLLNASLLCSLGRRGYRLHALAPLTPELDAIGDEALRRVGIPIECYSVPNLDNDPHNPAAGKNPARLASAMVGELRRLLARVRPALVLAGDENSGTGVVQAIGRQAIPFALIAHGLATRMLDGRYPRALRDLVLSSLRPAALVITVAAHMADSLRRLSVRRVVAIPNCVDTALFTPEPRDEQLRGELGLAREDCVVLHVSNLHPYKRPMDVVASARRALRDDARLRYLVIGDGPGRGAMEQAVAEAGIAARFRLLGRVPHAEMPRYYRVADVVAMPSETEGLSLVCLEAQASGCALLATDIAASRELMGGGATAVTCAVGDTEAMAAQTLRLSGDPSLRARIGAQARAHVVRHHDAKGWHDRYAAALDEVLQSAPRRS